MRSLLALFLLAGVPMSSLAMESSTVGSQTSQASVNVINSKVDAGLAALQAQLAAIQTCQALGEFYTVGHAGADANGCWSNGGTATNTIVAFNGTTCPSGWSEYTAARGKFLRGIDNGAGYDPGGTRAPGTYQADLVGPHQHYFSSTVQEFPAAWMAAGSGYGAWSGAGAVMNFPVAGWTDVGNTGAETRPRNVAVLFCVKN